MNCISPIFVRSQQQLVPCGKCAFCIKKAINAWAIRLNHELEYSSAAHFLTLTYDENHLPADGQLCKRDVQLFLKRLRKENAGIRYFLIGEYGTEKARPHYHAIIFNLEDQSLVTKHWQLGYVSGSPVKGGCINYMLNYMAIPAPDGITEKPFRLMSRRPGLGSGYLTKKESSFTETGKTL